MERTDPETETRPPLTEREAEIARLVSDGLTNAEIAQRLGISFTTAKWHVSQVLSKLGVDSRDAVADRLEETRPPNHHRRLALGWASLTPLFKSLGVAAAVVPVGVVVAATALVLSARGGDDTTAAAPPDATPAATLVPIVVRAEPSVVARITPPPQPHTCDWQLGQANVNNGPIDHSGCDFSGIDFGERGMMWNMAILRDASLEGVTIAGTFGLADFTGANLRGAQFVQSMFGDNDRSGTDFTGADLTGADFTNSIMAGATFAGATCPDGSPADFHGGTCLETQGLRNLPGTRSFTPALAMVGTTAPDFALESAEDPSRVLALGDYAGRPVVLVWTASWCFTPSRCVEVFSEVSAAAASHPNVPFLAVSLEQSGAAAVADAKARGFEFPVAIDTDMAASKAYNIIGPGLFTVIAPDGTIAPYANAAGLPRPLVQVLAQFE